jgi:hypothetical protein
MKIQPYGSLARHRARDGEPKGAVSRKIQRHDERLAGRGLQLQDHPRGNYRTIALLRVGDVIPLSTRQDDIRQSHPGFIVQSVRVLL